MRRKARNLARLSVARASSSKRKALTGDVALVWSVLDSKVRVYLSILVVVGPCLASERGVCAERVRFTLASYYASHFEAVTETEHQIIAVRVVCCNLKLCSSTRQLVRNWDHRNLVHDRRPVTVPLQPDFYLQPIPPLLVIVHQHVQGAVTNTVCRQRRVWIIAFVHALSTSEVGDERVVRSTLISVGEGSNPCQVISKPATCLVHICYLQLDGLRRSIAHEHTVHFAPRCALAALLSRVVPVIAAKGRGHGVRG